MKNLADFLRFDRHLEAHRSAMEWLATLGAMITFSWCTDCVQLFASGKLPANGRESTLVVAIFAVACALPSIARDFWRRLFDEYWTGRPATELRVFRAAPMAVAAALILLKKQSVIAALGAIAWLFSGLANLAVSVVSLLSCLLIVCYAALRLATVCRAFLGRHRGYPD